MHHLPPAISFVDGACSLDTLGLRIDSLLDWLVCQGLGLDRLFLGLCCSLQAVSKLVGGFDLQPGSHSQELIANAA